jgi:glycosyltransferase involved in cell wall biosynthesis
VVTSTVGELPSTVDDKSAIILEDPNTLNVTQAIATLCNDDELRAKIALGGLSRFTRDFNRERYLERWEHLMFKRQILDQ